MPAVIRSKREENNTVKKKKPQRYGRKAGDTSPTFRRN
jgi:hypothetical protein